MTSCGITTVIHTSNIACSSRGNWLKFAPFLCLLGADNGCNADCCKIKIIPGDDLRTCSCEHKRPIFVPKGYDDVVHNDMVQVEYGGALACICEVSEDFLPWCVPCASSDSEED